MLARIPAASALDQLDTGRQLGSWPPEASSRSGRRSRRALEGASGLVEIESKPRFRTGAEAYGLQLLLMRIHPGPLDAKQLGDLLGRHQTRAAASPNWPIEHLDDPSCDRFDVFGVEIHCALLVMTA